VADGDTVGTTKGLGALGRDVPNDKFKFLNVDAQGRLQTVVVQLPSGDIDQGLIDGRVDTSANMEYVIRATTYTEQTANAQRSINSTSASDTTVGTGARTVRISYFSTDMLVLKTEIITLNGTAAVNTTNTDIHFIEKLEIVTAGSNKANAGTIRLYTTINGGGTVFGSVAVGDNRTYWAHHYVPDGVILYMVAFVGGVKGNHSANMYGVYINTVVTDSVLLRVTPTFRLGAAGANSLSSSPGVPIAIVPGPARFELRLFQDAGGNDTFYGSIYYNQQ
jgi:hypothetical protein